MSDIDDLAELCADAFSGADLAYNEHHKLAEEIIAAGFHRNRTITTAEELDALAVGTVVVEGDHATPDEVVFGGLTTMPGVFHRFPDGWHVVAGDGARQVPLPATVLWKPEES
jgi:hypothetical protein